MAAEHENQQHCEEIVEEEEEEVVEEIEEIIEEEVEEEEEDGNGGIVPRLGSNVDGSAGDDMINQGSASSGSSSAGKIFVGGLAWETTDETFAEYFRRYGAIVDSVIMRDKHTQKPRGFGFITFADPSVVDRVLEDEHAIDGRMVEVKRTVPRVETSSKGGSKTKKIFVGGIPTSLTEDELNEHFSAYGKVLEHQIMLDHSTGRSRGFGFVTFESEESVEKLISEGKMHDLNGKQVEIKKAEPKRPGDSGQNSRAGYGAGNAYGSNGAGGYGYGGYRYGNMYYAGRPGGGYGRGYGAAGYGADYGASYGAAYGANMYAAAGYGAGGYGGTANGYGGTGAYGAYGSYGSGRGYGNRYHPYGR